MEKVRTNWNENRVTLRGKVVGEPEFSHMNHGEAFCMFPLCVPRLSGAEDKINVVCSNRLLRACPIKDCMCVEITGEVRTFNNRSGEGSRLVITVFARTLTAHKGEAFNQLFLTGVICKEPVLRFTPLGRNICDLIVAVNRRYGRADYLPCIAWGAQAALCGKLSVGDCVHIEGRLQSRQYRKMVDGACEERIAFEVSVIKLEQVT
ncbi:Single-stranded DNA-binding protein [bioreactor metagenome]|uniref:Single-stranded DNA-binding protein n=1 Tax=bioreactor metagenome TaxID=1076179 RepID=A0A645DH03_9ZZZZ